MRYGNQTEHGGTPRYAGALTPGPAEHVGGCR